MPYVHSDQYPTHGVEAKSGLTYIVTGKWEDLTTLAQQIKWLGKEYYQVVLISGKINFQEEIEHQLIVSGDVYVPDDKTYNLVEQRIAEGFEVKIVHGRYYRPSYVFTYDEKLDKSIPAIESLEDLDDHPF